NPARHDLGLVALSTRVTAGREPGLVFVHLPPGPPRLVGHVEPEIGRLGEPAAGRIRADAPVGHEVHAQRFVVDDAGVPRVRGVELVAPARREGVYGLAVLDPPRPFRATGVQAGQELVGTAVTQLILGYAGQDKLIHRPLDAAIGGIDVRVAVLVLDV